MSGSARVHLVTKPVRRCYLSSLAGARQSFSSPASPALTTLQSERNGSFERAVENGSVAPTRPFADRTPPQSCRSRREKASLDCLLPVRTEERGFCHRFHQLYLVAFKSRLSCVVIRPTGFFLTRTKGS